MLAVENTSIRKKLIVIQLATAFMAVLFSSAFFVYNDVQIYKDTSVKTKYTIAEIVGINATSALEFMDQDAAKQMLAKLKSNPTILNAVILDKTGKEFARYDKVGVDTFSFSPEAEAKVSAGKFGQRFVVSYQIFNRELLGTVKLRAELSGFNQVIVSYLKIAALILGLSLVVAFFISAILQGSITTRLLALVNKTKQVADTGDYSIRVPVDGQDEIATLSSSFNYMLGQIAKMQGVLKGTNVELERRVRNRTQELEAANSNLRESEETVQTIFRTAPNALVVIDEESRVTAWNERAADIFGWTVEEIFGKPMHEMIMPEHFRPRHLAGISHFLATGEGPVFNKTLELTGLRKNGREFPMEIRISYTKTKDKYLFIAFISDITDRKKAEAQLIQRTDDLARTNKELEQFVYIASHDLQEPLRTISNYTGLLEEKYSQSFDDTAKRYFASILKAASRMRTLIKDLLELSRIGKDVTITEVNTNEVLKEVIAQLDAAIQESGTNIIFNNLPIVKGNEGELKQLFQNLISNAIKFRKKEGPSVIEISAEEKPKEFLFSIKDNGIGIDEQYKERIFVVFQRLHSKNEYPGTGIGLATCLKIVALHRGKIWVESQPGIGSTFFFTISKNLKLT